jgi:DNA-binding transcriptional regulator YhcF (GntR family)
MVKALDIKLDRNSDQSIYMQIYNQIAYNISIGKLQKGDIIPSSRILATVLDINFHTVNQAYQKLRENGIISIGKNRRYFVAAGKKAEMSSKLLEKEKTLINEALAMGYNGEDIIESMKQILSSSKRE